MELIYGLLEDRFGLVPEDLREQLEQASMEELRRLTLQIGKVHTLAELGLHSR